MPVGAPNQMITLITARWWWLLNWINEMNAFLISLSSVEMIQRRFS